MPDPLSKAAACSVPGIHLLVKTERPPEDDLSLGPFYVQTPGHLLQRATRAGWTLVFDGVLTTRWNEHQSDAETALEVFLRDGLGGMSALEGFYNILLLHPAAEEGYLLSDTLCSRPWYLYHAAGTLAAAPTPVAFVQWELPMSLNPQALYESLRLLHTGYDRTLVREVERVLPGRAYAFDATGRLERQTLQTFTHRPDRSLDLEASAQWLKELIADAVGGVLTHPRLRDLPVHLPLTAGLDSRHLLGELLDQQRPPAAIRHVHIQESDLAPVRHMVRDLDLPLAAPRLATLDTAQLLRRWAARCGGLVNVHQYYLMHLSQGTPRGGAVGFSGYMMDSLLGIAPKADPHDEATAHMPLWNRTYTGPAMLALLVPDVGRLRRQTERLFREETECYEGPPWFQMLMMDLHHRGLHYTGTHDAMLADEAFYFSPGASAEALRFASTVPRDQGGDRRARLHALRRYFPELAGYPDPHGMPYARMEVLRKPRANAWTQNLGPLLRALGSGLRQDPAPDSEHAWLRHIPALRRAHRAVVQESALVRDGYLRHVGMQTSWRLLTLGGYQGWTLMSLLTAEVAYRVLVKGEPAEDIADWLGPARAW